MSDPNQDQIVYVDKSGHPTGRFAAKLDAHNAQTKLHLAFSCYVFNNQGKLLVTQRALGKKVWPGVWSNSVCGHPFPNEPIEQAVARRLDYELGMSAYNVQIILDKYIYKTPPYRGVIEHEFCPIYVARAKTLPQPNRDEVEDYQWLAWEDYVSKAESDTSDKYSWWCKDQLKHIKNHPLIKQYSQPVLG